MNQKQQEARAEFLQWCRDRGYETVLQLMSYGKKRMDKHAVARLLERRKFYRQNYLKSDHWFSLRDRKLAANPKCERCGGVRDLVPHHLCYRNLYDVELQDLQTVCGGCHFKIHTKDIGAVYRQFLTSHHEYAFDAPCVECLIAKLPEDDKPKKHEKNRVKRLRDLRVKVNALIKSGRKLEAAKMLQESIESNVTLRRVFAKHRKLKKKNLREAGVWIPSAKY